MIDWSQLVAYRLGDDPLRGSPTRIQIPRPPQSVAEFVEVVERPDVSLRQVAAIVERDVELASHVLRLVNSSTLMLRQKISSIHRAIGLLGLRRCKMLVMSAALHASFPARSTSTTKVESFLSEAQERALYSAKIASLLDVDTDHVYVASLLQDLLLFHMRDEFHEQYRNYDHQSESIVDFERTRLGWDHGLLAGQVLRNWNFADEIVASVCYHHDHQIILSDPELCRSPVAAVAISSLLPSAYTQEPNCISMFMQYQNAIPEFDFLEVATQLDEEILQSEMAGQRTPMADRLERLAVAAVQQGPRQSNWVEQQLGSYTLEEEIGRGGMGIVYRARHTMLRRPAAVKMLQASKISPESMDRFHVEARITSELSSPHTVQVYDYGTTPDGGLYYVMEYLDGMSLSELVTQFGPLPEERIIHILCQVCGSLSEAHGKGLIHRDIKPENIALTTCAGAHDFAKVLDFGLVSVLGEHFVDTEKTTVIGTPSYMSPESIHFPEDVDERSDIYALGSVAYFMATGRILFGDYSLKKIIRAQVEEQPPSLKESGADNVSEKFEQIILCCLAKNPDDRPQSVVQFAELLNELPASNDWNFSEAASWWKRHNASGTESLRRLSSLARSEENCRTIAGATAVPAVNEIHQSTTTIMD